MFVYIQLFIFHHFVGISTIVLISYYLSHLFLRHIKYGISSARRASVSYRCYVLFLYLLDPNPHERQIVANGHRLSSLTLVHGESWQANEVRKLANPSAVIFVHTGNSSHPEASWSNSCSTACSIAGNNNS
ncbi:hypothetical protein ES703_102608 [subsurface metagenome]